MAVYLKSTIGVLLVFTGILASPEETPVMRVARVFLQITGIGFGFYCLAAIGLFLAGLRMRLRPTAVTETQARQPSEWP
ncbi:hypothetical protein D0T12_20570 [Actinomadura spongiicola]|uniref:Uncharacterized protein n=1 Tax=Actinomadura spongiicola TaxID=2303421 RepID=A0A372GDJ1_9ACTN|nr:hypothetical protein [Actinomadura spongiicola]RFS83446.1 hypothetical protein D0T12_20570 [Actinomadura spongiicola]